MIDDDDFDTIEYSIKQARKGLNYWIDTIEAETSDMYRCEMDIEYADRVMETRKKLIEVEKTLRKAKKLLTIARGA